MAKLLQGAANDSFTAQPPNIYSIPSFFEGREEPGALSAGARSLKQAGFGIQRGAILTENEMAHNEIRNAQVAASGLELQHTQQLQAALANNGNLGDLQQKQENDWADFGQNYETGQAQQAVSLLRNQALDRTTQRFNQAYSIQFGQNVKAQGAALTSNLSQSVASGNLALPDAEGQIDAYVNTFPHVASNLRSATAQELKSQIEGAAASVAIRSNPADAQNIVGGFTHLTPEQRTQLLGNAQEQVRMNVALAGMRDSQQRFTMFMNNYNASQQWQTAFEGWVQGGQKGDAPNPLDYPGMDAASIHSARSQITTYTHNPGISQPVDENAFDHFSTGIANGVYNTLNLDAALKKSDLPLAVQNSLRAQAEAVQRSDPNVAGLRDMWTGLAAAPQILPIVMMKPGVRGVWYRQALNQVLKDEQNGGDPRKNSLDPKSDNFVGSVAFFDRAMGISPTPAQNAASALSGAPRAPVAVPLAPPTVPTISSQAEYDALKAGEAYSWNGKRGIKR